MLLVTAAEMRALDREVIEQVGVPGVVLMDAAGRGVVDVIAARADLSRARVVVYAGAGNNGGDGFVVARHLANRGAAVEVVLCAPADKVSGDALVHLLAAERSGVPFHDAADADGLARAAARTADAGVVVDALFGTGLTREVTGHLAQAIEDINAHRGLKVAVDVPSGLDADRGVPLGACVRADHTVTFAFAKRGLVSAPGFTFVGELHVADIGIPERLARARGVRAELLSKHALSPLVVRDPLGHKGTHGHLLLLAGSSGKTGAALLAGLAALRSGVGLCTVAAPHEAQAALDGRVPELMTAWYGATGDNTWDELAPLLEGKRAVAAGPGMPPSLPMREVLGHLCRAAAERGIALVLDADALNHLAADPSLLDGHAAPERVVLTPHPGEAARLLARSTADVQSDRTRAALELAQRFAATVALKGARTVVAAPDGRLAICPAGNPGMGTGGTGDVLTGCTGALLARGLDGFAAACAAVFWHASAGDRVAAERGAIGITAGDVANALPATLLAMTN
jgi:ADP-dependent NAD(P)H-hydrate dehydratase / NAD(P)H-hydrate epimerase